MNSNTIPTALEFMNQHHEDGEISPQVLIEFAKLHVTAALEAASYNAKAKENPSDYGTGEIWVDKKSILESYSLNNIK